MRLGTVTLLTLATTFGCTSTGDAPATPAAADTLVALPLATIGALDGPPEYLFGDVSAVALGPGDIVYVADLLGSNVRAYDLEGASLATIGSEGDGPGEFQRPNDLTLDPEGNLYARDSRRVTVFGRTAASEVRDSVVRTLSLSRSSAESTRARTDGTTYYSPSYFYYMFVRHRYFYEVLDVSGPTGDTVLIPIANPQILGRANVFVADGTYAIPTDGINMAPFEPRPSWDITREGRVLVTAGDRYEIVEITPVGDTRRVIRRASVP
jgi:hypothetical protein